MAAADINDVAGAGASLTGFWLRQNSDMCTRLEKRQLRHQPQSPNRDLLCLQHPFGPPLAVYGNVFQHEEFISINTKMRA
jgi:hypothetical protein